LGTRRTNDREQQRAKTPKNTPKHQPLLPKSVSHGEKSVFSGMTMHKRKKENVKVLLPASEHTQEETRRKKDVADSRKRKEIWQPLFLVRITSERRWKYFQKHIAWAHTTRCMGTQETIEEKKVKNGKWKELSQRQQEEYMEKIRSERGRKDGFFQTKAGHSGWQSDADIAEQRKHTT
jgi:hypothetical protein